MLILLWLGCASPKSSSKEDSAVFYPPDAVGPHSVSSRVDTVVSRHGFEFEVQVWYPTQETDEDIHLYGGFFEGGIASDDADPNCDETWPVMAFSHGNTGMRYQSIFYGEYLASHGYIVVSPDHVGNTFFDNDEALKPELILRRPEDISDTIDWLFSSSDFGNCVDPDDGFAMSGHSFGGYTAVAISGGYLDTDATSEFCSEYGGWLCDDVEMLASELGSGVYSRQDDRIWASIPMAPAAYETLLGGLSNVEVPMMVLGGTKDTATTMTGSVLPIYDGMPTSSRMLGKIQDAGHFSFSDACDLLPSYPDCGGDYLSSDIVQSLVNTSSVAFLGWLQGDEEMSNYLPLEDDLIDWVDDR